MRRYNVVLALAAAALGVSFMGYAVEYAGTNGMFLITTTPKSVDAAAAAIRDYAAERQWLYLAEFKVKNGEVTLLKLCVPSVAKRIWAAGIHVGAMAPCGNLSVYREAGTTRIALLHPKFMDALNPDPNLKQVGDELLPLFTAMLDEVGR